MRPRPRCVDAGPSVEIGLLLLFIAAGLSLAAYLSRNDSNMSSEREVGLIAGAAGAGLLGLIVTCFGCGVRCSANRAANREPLLGEAASIQSQPPTAVVSSASSVPPSNPPVSSHRNSLQNEPSQLQSSDVIHVSIEPDTAVLSPAAASNRPQ